MDARGDCESAPLHLAARNFQLRAAAPCERVKCRHHHTIGARNPKVTDSLLYIRTALNQLALEQAVGKLGTESIEC